jgi:hypothetical protein
MGRMQQPRRIEPGNLSDRKLWELLRLRAAELDKRERDGVMRELLARGQMRPDRDFRAPR